MGHVRYHGALGQAADPRRALLDGAIRIIRHAVPQGGTICDQTCGELDVASRARWLSMSPRDVEFEGDACRDRAEPLAQRPNGRRIRNLGAMQGLLPRKRNASDDLGRRTRLTEFSWSMHEMPPSP